MVGRSAVVTLPSRSKSAVQPGNLTVTAFDTLGSVFTERSRVTSAFPTTSQLHGPKKLLKTYAVLGR